MEGTSVNVPVQSVFTEYVPFIVAWSMLPFTLTHMVAVVPPFPSKVSMPTPAKGPACRGGAAAAVKNPALVYANVPVSVAFDHPFQQPGFRDDEPRLMGWPRVAGNLERFRYRLPDLKHSIQTSPVEQTMQRRVYAA